MPKRILLVDDEKLFLKSLKEGLATLSKVFTTDICYSVNEAIKQVAINDYDLVITDIRMPEKSGIELLIYLKEARFPGKIIVMSAYNNPENTETIRSLGVVDVITKPFKLEWFKNLLIEHFQDEGAGTVVFETIDLVTVMQVINLERKTSALQIDVDGKKGMIYFVDGEVVHAIYNDLEGEEAILKLIALSNDSTSISVKKIRNKVPRTIQLPFVKQMMSIMQTIDELRRDEEILQPKGQVIETQVVEKQENRDLITAELGKLLSLNGCAGAGIFSPEGEMLMGTPEFKVIPFDRSGGNIQDMLSDARSLSARVGYGQVQMVEVHTEAGIILVTCSSRDDHRKYFYTVLALNTESSLALARIKLKKVADALLNIF